MNKQDEYYFIVVKAISEPQISNNHYYYDALTERVFCLSFKGGRFYPHYRNLSIKPSIDKMAVFTDLIKKVENNESSIHELSRISTQSKKDFLSKYVDSIPDLHLKQILYEELEGYTDENPFAFKFDLSHYNKSIYSDFDKQKHLFLFPKIEEMYSFFNWDIILDVVW